LAAISLGPLAAITGCGGASDHDGAGGRPNLDVRLLNRSLDLEYEAIAAYTAGIPLLAGRAREAAKRFLDQELAHSGELAGLVKQAGGKPNRARSAYDLGHPQGSAGVLGLLADLERRELAMYLDAATRITRGSTRAALAAVLGSDAQHLTVLRGLIGLDPIPSVLTGAIS